MNNATQSEGREQGAVAPCMSTREPCSLVDGDGKGGSTCSLVHNVPAFT